MKSWLRRLRPADLWDRPPSDGWGSGQLSQELAFVAVGEAGAVWPCILSSDFPLKGGGEGVRQRAQCKASPGALDAAAQAIRRLAAVKHAWLIRLPHGNA